MKPSKQQKPQKRKNRFLEPILEALNLDQLYFFIVLLGLTPAVSDYSLFLPFGASHLDFLYKVPSPLYIGIAAMLPVGLFICIRKRSLWMLIGLLPAIVGVTIKLVYSLTIVEDTTAFSIAMFVAYKLAFLYFIVKGHLRSLAFLLVAVVLASFFPVLQLLSFVLFALLCRITYLAVSQNISILSVLKPKNLFKLSFRTLLAWSPILLFAVPSYLFTKYLGDYIIENVYQETFVNRHNLHTTKKMDDLREYPLQENLRVSQLSESGYVKSKEHLDKVLRIVKYRSDSLEYDKDYTKGVEDFKELYLLYQEVYNDTSPYESNWFVAEHVSLELEKVLINKYLPGRSEFELDINLSINEKFAKQERDAKAKADSINQRAQKALNAEIDKVNREMDKLLAKSQAIEAKGRTAIGDQQKALIAEAEETSAAMKATADKSIGNVNNAIEKDINAIPDQANGLFAKAVPQTLVEVSPGFAASDCGFFSIKCKAFNLVKSLLRKVYAQQREKAKNGVDASAKRARDKANRRRELAMRATEKTVGESLFSAESKIGEATSKVAQDANRTNADVFAAINKEIHASGNAVKDEFRKLKETAHATNAEVKTGIESGYDSAKELVRGILLLVYKGVFFFGLFSNIMLGILIIKSYFYVFSRITFSDKSNVNVDIKEHSKSFENGVLTQCGIEYSIPVDNAESIYLSRKYVPTGRAPKAAIPRWTNGIVARILNGVYLMNEVEVRQNEKETVDFRSTGGAEFVEWNLSDGEEVVFNYKDLVAMSDSLTLSSHISFRLTSMFFGKAKFHIAKGPGKLVLKTQGKPITNEREHLVKSVPINRIIAWQRTTQFSVDSELNMIDMYFSGVYLKRTNDDLIIVDADAGNTKRKVGLARFVTKFLLPI